MVNIISAILVGKNAEITVMALEGSLKDCLLRGKELSDDEISALKDRLCSKTVQELRILAKGVNVRLTGSSRKVDIVIDNRGREAPGIGVFKISHLTSRPARFLASL